MSNRVCYKKVNLINSKTENVNLRYYTDETLELEYSMLNEDGVSQNDIFMTFAGEDPKRALEAVLMCLFEQNFEF